MKMRPGIRQTPSHRSRTGRREVHGIRKAPPWRGGALLLALGLLGLQFRSEAAEQPPREIKPDAPCATQTCHPSILKIKNLHAPAAENGCASCHVAKDNLHQFTLSAQGPDLCATCHGPLEKKKVLHKPVGEGCTTCHNPHGGDTSAFLVDLPPQLCLKCHTKIAAKFEKAPMAAASTQGVTSGGPPMAAVSSQGVVSGGPVSSHSAALQGKACLTCHNPHTSDFADLLSAKPMDVCLGCHNREIKADGKILPDVKAEITGAKVVHGPIQDGDCSACHDAHASSYFALLQAAYPATFYARFTPDAYALCFQCHDQALVSDARTKDATSFRNGTENLHTVHVKDDGKGRTCRACHAPHGSNLPHLIRAFVPFGPIRWPLPIGFQETKTGGSCAPGCHAARAYDREKAAEESK